MFVVCAIALTDFRTVPVTMNIKEDELNIVDVYADTFDERMDEIVKIAEQYPVIGIDTEFPGTFPDHAIISALSSKEPLCPLVQKY